MRPNYQGLKGKPKYKADRFTNSYFKLMDRGYVVVLVTTNRDIALTSFVRMPNVARCVEVNNDKERLIAERRGER